jgi:hypothetical protein
MDDPKDFKLNDGRPLPPVETRWKPGESGNPKGRPKNGESLTSLLRELVFSACPNDPERRRFAELLVRRVLQEALKGDLRSFKEICNRLEGRVPFPIERVVPKEPDRRVRPSGAPQILSLDDKNELLESLGIEPINEEPKHNGVDTRPNGE